MSDDPDDAFETWLAHIDDFLEELRASVPEDLEHHLDFSIASLEPLEAHILTRFGSLDEATNKDASSALNLFAVYVGETMRKTGGGIWSIRTDDPEYAFHNKPIITGCGQNGNNTDCPLSLVTASIDRRRGNYLRTVIQHLTS